MTTILYTLILLFINPVGFLIIMLVLLFFEYLIIKSVIEDAKIVLNYIKNHKPKFITFVSYQIKAIDIFKKKNIVIREVKETPSTIGPAIDYIKMNEWFSR